MQFSFIKSSLNTACITSFYGKRQYDKISKLQNRLICLLDGKILCRFTQPQNKPYAFSTKPMMLYTHFDAKFVTFWILKNKNSSNQIFVVDRFGIVKSGHSLFKIQVIFLEHQHSSHLTSPHSSQVVQRKAMNCSVKSLRCMDFLLPAQVGQGNMRKPPHLPQIEVTAFTF